MATLILIGYSLANIDGYDLKICNYRHPSLTQTVNMFVPPKARCLKQLKLK